ncbi:MAG: DUF58 domain-containing protein, partial [Chloroflexota bacterium]|nr:DUF58 domain-containing protein [Chloroflexota bacterium]
MIRRVELCVLAIVLLVVAFSTGADFLFFVVYLGVLVVGGSYVLTRFGLSELEAGYSLDRVQGRVGERLSATYTVRNTSRLPKLWLEAYTPSTLPIPLPGRGVALAPKEERSWIARVPLTRRGHYRVEPLVIRTGDPLGFFEASATVGAAAAVTVYPRVELLPRWRLPPAAIEGTHSRPERTIQATPLVTSIRPYLPGDAYNRIHWKVSARQGELQVKEFDLEQTADVWLFLDLERTVHTGGGDESTLEAGVRVAAAIAAQALLENRAVGMTASGHRVAVLPVDRGSRQHQKVMQLLAAVMDDGSVPLVETLIAAMHRLRRGMTAVVVTPSVDREWVRPLAALRGRGVAAVACLLDGLAYEERARQEAEQPPLGLEVREQRTRAQRAIRHALSEYDVRVHTVVPDRPLGELLVSGDQPARPAR